MMVKTSELSGAALDWAVAKAVHGEPKDRGSCFRIYSNGEPIASIWKSGGTGMTRLWQPSIDWGQCGPLIERFVYSAITYENGWLACCDEKLPHSGGRTLLEASCRAIVAAKLGKEVDIPDELMKGAVK